VLHRRCIWCLNARIICWLSVTLSLLYHYSYCRLFRFSTNQLCPLQERYTVLRRMDSFVPYNFQKFLTITWVIYVHWDKWYKTIISLYIESLMRDLYVMHYDDISFSLRFYTALTVVSWVYCRYNIYIQYIFYTFCSLSLCSSPSHCLRTPHVSFHPSMPNAARTVAM